LARARWDMQGEDLESPVRGIVKRVRVITVVRGPKKISTNLFYGRSDMLDWDPKRYQWNSLVLFMSYTSKIGRNLLKQRHVIPNVVVRKWQGVLPATFKFKWDNA
jgi:hypothetical protein